MTLLCVGLSTVAVVPFFLMGQPLAGRSRWDLRMPATHDVEEHFDQMRDFYQGLVAGEVYPRWEEDTNYGFGAPTTCFYPPGVYYLTGALYLWLRDWTRVLLSAPLLMMIASAGAMYWLARRSMSRMAAAVAMAAYVVLPYHLADQYYREAIAELLAFVWMPLMIGFADQLLEPQDSLSVGSHRIARSGLLAAGLAAAYGAFLWSHPPTAYQFTLAFILLVPLLAMLRQSWRGLLWVAGGLALGLGLSAAYLYPAAVEAHFIRHEVIQEFWPYRDTYLFLRPASQFVVLLDTTWWFGILTILPTALAFLTLTPRRKPPGRGSRLRSNVVFWAALGSFASFLMLRVSDAIGRRIPKIDIGVFSWRMLAITTLVGALLAGAVAEALLHAWRERHRIRLALFAILATAIVAGGALLSILRVVVPVNAFPAFQPELVHLNYVIIPRTAPEDPEDLPDMDRVEMDGESVSASVVQWKPQHRVIGVKTTKATRLRIRTFNYPGWAAALDGRPISIGTDQETGAILVDVPAGEHLLALDFLDTPARRLGVAITLPSVVTTLAFAGGGLARLACCASG